MLVLLSVSLSYDVTNSRRCMNSRTVCPPVETRLKQNHSHCWKLWYNIATSPELEGLMDQLSVEAGWKVGGGRGEF
jgi:hypothetical protein